MLVLTIKKDDLSIILANMGFKNQYIAAENQPECIYIGRQTLNSPTAVTSCPTTSHACIWSLPWTCAGSRSLGTGERTRVLPNTMFLLHW